MLRDHNPIAIEQFNGLWQRGDKEATPLDHFTDCNNVDYFHEGVKNRDGINTYRGVANVVRMYNYTTQNGPSLIYLTSEGKIYHSVSPTVTYGPLLNIPAMTDFAFTSYAGRAYISPHNGLTGLTGEFVYVYKGDGTPARKAAGAPPPTAPTLGSTGSGTVEKGIHIFGVVYETESGFLTGVSPLVSIDAPGNQSVIVNDIPTSGSTTVVARRVVASRAIDPTAFTGNLSGYKLYFVPEGRIPNNTATSITVSFYDADLLDDAWHLVDLFSEIPAGVGLNVYHGRLLSWGEAANISLVRVSNLGEPEAFNEIDGFIIFPLDGKPITYAQEFRDVLYVYKETKTKSWSDNGDVPSSWPMVNIDEGIGCLLHGMATVLDSSGVNINFLMMANFSGLMMFNGNYLHPELTWKIENLWRSFTKEELRNFQVLNDSQTKRIYINLPGRRILMGDYSDGLDPKTIKWAKWSFNIETSTIALTEINRLAIGSSLSVPA